METGDATFLKCPSVGACHWEYLGEKLCFLIRFKVETKAEAWYSEQSVVHRQIELRVRCFGARGAELACKYTSPLTDLAFLSNV